MIPVILSVSQVHGFAKRESKGDELDPPSPHLFMAAHTNYPLTLTAGKRTGTAGQGCLSLPLTAFGVHQILASWHDR